MEAPEFGVVAPDTHSILAEWCSRITKATVSGRWRRPVACEPAGYQPAHPLDLSAGQAYTPPIRESWKITKRDHLTAKERITMPQLNKTAAGHEVPDASR